MRTQEQVNEIVRLLLAEYPEAVCSLDYGKDYELLFSVRLSAQCTDERVNMVTPALFARYPTLEAFAEADVAEVEQYVHSCGFYHAKARDIVNCAIVLLEKHNGKVPDTMEELVKLPGVGEKTAKVVLNVGFGKGVIAVDTHILRVARRLGLSSAKTPAGVSRDLEAITPTDYIRNAHHYLLLHGRYTCKAQRPLCGSCALRDLCRSADSAEGKKAAQGKG